MADKIILKGELRKKVGSSSSAKLRKSGKLPVVMYGHGEEATSLSVDSHILTESIHHGQRLFDLQVDGKTETVLLKDLQYDYLGKDFVHVDFIRVNLAEVVTVTVELDFKGSAAGTHEGGMLDIHLDAIDVECKVSDIPEVIEVNVREIRVGDSIHASDIELPEGIGLATDPEALILNCYVVTEAPAEGEAEEEMPSGPEVITERAEKPEEE